MHESKTSPVKLCKPCYCNHGDAHGMTLLTPSLPLLRLQLIVVVVVVVAGAVAVAVAVAVAAAADDDVAINFCSSSY